MIFLILVDAHYLHAMMKQKMKMELIFHQYYDMDSEDDEVEVGFCVGIMDYHSHRR